MKRGTTETNYEKNLTEKIYVRISRKDKLRLERKAGNQGLSLSEYVRRRAVTDDEYAPDPDYVYKWPITGSLERIADMTDGTVRDELVAVIRELMKEAP